MGSRARVQPNTSLYVTFKVVQLVNQLRRRLRSHVLSVEARGAELRNRLAFQFAEDATKGISKIITPRSKERNRISKHRNGAQDALGMLKARESCRRSQTDVKQSLEALSGEVGEQLGFNIVRTAEDDAQFIRKDCRPVFGHLTWLQAANNIQLVNAALDILAVLRNNRWTGSSSDPSMNGWKLEWSVDEKTCANLEHLLLCIRHSLIQTFVTKAFDDVRASSEWRYHWQRHLKFGGDKWCAEFPDSHGPISTTSSFPWSIQPSLAVLWGVCWMFYPDDTQGGWWQQQHQPHGLPQYAGDETQSRPEQQRAAYSAAAPTPSAGRHEAERRIIGAGAQAAPAHGRPDCFRHRDDGSSAPPHGSWRRPQVKNLNSAFGPHRPPSSPTGTHQVHNPSTPASAHRNPWSSGHQGLAASAPSGTYAAPAQLAALFNSPQDASTRAGFFSPDILGPFQTSGISFVNQSTWCRPGPQAHLAARNSPLVQAFDTAAATATAFTATSLGVTGLQASQPPFTQPHQYSSPASHINPPPLRPEDLPTFLVPDTPFFQPQQFPNMMAVDPNNTTDPALTGEQPDLKPQDAADLAAAAVSGQHGDMSEDPSSPDGIEPFSPRRGFTHKRNEDPPRNDAGKMMCRFQTTCAGITFDRRCEWSKHMDKHERPYKCNAPGCEKLQGFTYSGGLLRHQREVHKMHGGTKKALYCPEPNCKRNTGTGFTRKENLSEHIRRVHRRATDSVVPYGDGTIPNAPVARMLPEAIEQLEAAARDEVELNDVTDPALTNNKRKHDDLEMHENGDDGNVEVRILQDEVKRLKSDLDDRDNRFKTLEDQFHKQTELLQQLLNKTT